ncbi:hypothetical protein TraAM80_00687 [Trypanosoma rangeli]|uniref:Uncharacterized protein n=1 Tax=Trypanosoma rangeli TaxID=5698 RepID=A0A422P2B5_TRYRA|nr:uncharacterized protein TraAM80_00687 [Trypanosoma rangeli]RNF11852.1 hypothetical protein TraAM80_00687 [Trypanosoma rangeli]|eukprot:RNF11852.1 hypothetical protein TraAM80_00687 [Trypanosoma rangeli]
MTALDFGVAMQDQRLTPFTQVMARLALDGETSPFHSDALMSSLYRAALAPFCCVEDERDLAAVCAAVLRGVFADAKAEPSGTIAGEQLTPAFITRGSDRGGLLAERRFLLRLKEQHRVARIIIPQTTSY